eukprot:SAG22_NODE_382_length_11344_cov_41.312228_4_plen_72_part_00
MAATAESLTGGGAGAEDVVGSEFDLVAPGEGRKQAAPMVKIDVGQRTKMHALCAIQITAQLITRSAPNVAM